MGVGDSAHHGQGNAPVRCGQGSTPVRCSHGNTLARRGRGSTPAHHGHGDAPVHQSRRGGSSRGSAQHEGPIPVIDADDFSDGSSCMI